jgi:hypothetical protein
MLQLSTLDHLKRTHKSFQRRKAKALHIILYSATNRRKSKLWLDIIETYAAINRE